VGTGRYCRPGCARRGEEFISFEAAVGILQTELKFPEHRALHFVKRFDHNQDGRLSADEFNEFRRKVEETYVVRR